MTTKPKYWTALRDKKVVETCRSVAQIQFKLLITKIYDDLLSVQLYSTLIKLISFVHYHYYAEFCSNQHYPAAAVVRGKSERASFRWRASSVDSQDTEGQKVVALIVHAVSDVLVQHHVFLCWRNKVHMVRFGSWSQCLSVYRISGHLPKVDLDSLMWQDGITGRGSCACFSPGWGWREEQ